MPSKSATRKRRSGSASRSVSPASRNRTKHECPRCTYSCFQAAMLKKHMRDKHPGRGGVRRKTRGGRKGSRKSRKGSRKSRKSRKSRR